MRKNPQLPLVNVSRGAPMGRDTHINVTRGDIIKCRMFRVRLYDGYDEGGAYWGSGTPLYACISDNVELFTRANSRNEAKNYFKNKLPHITLKFYR